jgi:uncharacterized protein (TIGR03546 family)
MILYWTITFFKYLGRDARQYQFALGVSKGMLLGLIAITTLHWILIATFPFVFRMNLLATFCSFVGFDLVARLFESYFESFGFWILTEFPALLPWFSRAYHAPLLPYTSFNHSQVMGSSLLGLALFFPVFFLTRFVVAHYKEQAHAFWLSTRIQRAYAHARRLVD